MKNMLLHFFDDLQGGVLIVIMNMDGATESNLNSICTQCEFYRDGHCPWGECKAHETLRIDQDQTIVWHDLLEDPTDLPKETGYYLLRMSCPDGHYYANAPQTTLANDDDILIRFNAESGIFDFNDTADEWWCYPVNHWTPYRWPEIILAWGEEKEVRS